MTYEHNIDIRKLHNIGHTGIRRAVLFMGLGLNAAHRDDFNEYQLAKIPHFEGQTEFPIEFFPDNLPDEQVGMFKQEFASWVMGCGFREILEHYALVLDQIHFHSLVLLKSIGERSETFDGQKAQKSFEGFGIPQKLAQLEKITGLTFDGADSVCLLYAARNALTHNLGLVTTDRAPHGSLAITWRAFNVEAVNEDTNEVQSTFVMARDQIVTTAQTLIRARVVLREKKFAVGTLIRLTHQDLSEICYFFNAIVLKSTLDRFGEFVVGKGVPMTTPRESS